MLCYPRLPQIKDIPCIIGCEPISASRKKFRKIYHLWGKGYLAGDGTICESQNNSLAFLISSLVMRLNSVIFYYE